MRHIRVRYDPIPPFEEVRSPAIEAHKKVPCRHCSISLVGIHHEQMTFDVCQEIMDDVCLVGLGWVLFAEVLYPLHLVSENQRTRPKNIVKAGRNWRLTASGLGVPGR